MVPGVEDVIQLQEPRCRVRLKVSSRAKRFILRLASSGDGAELTLPPRVPRREVDQFLTRHKDWLAQALAKAGPRVVVADGSSLPIDGITRQIVHVAEKRSLPILDHDTLTVFGRGAVGAKVSAWLKSHARDTMVPSAQEFARQLGRKIR